MHYGTSSTSDTFSAIQTDDLSLGNVCLKEDRRPAWETVGWNVRVLVVDDDAGDRELIRRYLDRIDSWNVECWESTGADLEAATVLDRGIDIVLLDYILAGGKTGLDVLKEIEPYRDACPVVMLTGHGDEEIAAATMRAGACDYIVKASVSSEDLKQCITYAVKTHQLKTALRKQHQELSESHRELVRRGEEIRAFYHTVSHEMNAPLAAALGLLTMMVEGAVGPLTEEQNEYLGLIKQGCDDLSRFAQDLLDVARLESGKLSMNRERASLRPLVASLVKSLTLAAQGKGVSLEEEIEDELPELFIDSTRITQVIGNLCNNALKFTPSGGRILVRVVRNPETPDFVTVAVEDTGRGIEAKYLERIFDRLFQVTSEDATSKGGLGLGLKLCKDVVRLHGGEIWVKSEPGKGSTFQFTLPTGDVS